MGMALRVAVAEHPTSSAHDAGWVIGQAMIEATLLEVSSHPKPGLVTPLSSGAHSDMNLQTFMASTAAIAPCFFRCAEMGYRHIGAPSQLFSAIRAIGCEYERRLLAATGGVNTQRGLLFCGGVFSGAAGLVSRRAPDFSIENLTSAVAEMAAGLSSRELEAGAGLKPTTAGEILHARYGVRGVRGEVEDGFPTVFRYGLPALVQARADGASDNAARVHALISLMAQTEDTTVLWRGGWQALEFVRERARAILEKGGALTPTGWAEIERFDAECISRNISPGGSADLMVISAAAEFLIRGDSTFPKRTELSAVSAGIGIQRVRTS